MLKSIWLFLSLGCFPIQAIIPPQKFTQETITLDEIIKLKSIHEALFDFYFPAMGFFTHQDEIDRNEWKNAVWYSINTDQEMLALLSAFNSLNTWLPEDLQRLFPEIKQKGFAGANYAQQAQFLTALRRHSSNKLRMHAAKLRSSYVALCYNSPLVNKIAGVATIKQEGLPLNFEFPHSKLIFEDNEIKHAEGPIDFLIIGSGPAGSVIGYELACKHPECRIVMLDAGPFVKPGAINTESVSVLMEQANRRTNESGGLIIRNGWTVGGGTTVNLDLAFSPLLPTVQDHLQKWVDDSSVEYSLFHTAEQKWQKVHEAYQWVTDMVGTRTVTPTEINANNSLLLNGVKTARTYDLNEQPFAENGTPVKISAVDTFLIPALCNQKPCCNSFSLIPEVKVKRVLFRDNAKNKLAEGVEIEFCKQLDYAYIINDPNKLNIPAGTRAYIKARHIILSAGTLGSAEILLRSELNNPEIGKGIVVHPSIGLIGRFDKIIDPHKGLSCAVYASAEDPADDYFFESMGAAPAFIPFLHQGNGIELLNTLKDFRRLGGFGIMLIDSVDKNNCLQIDPITNKITIKYTLSDYDKERMRKALKRAASILFAQGAQEIYIPTCEAIINESTDYIALKDKDTIENVFNKIQFIENENFVSSAHMQGSNKMGNNPAASVVSPQFKVWDTITGKEIANLFVVDSSIFPTSVGANPMQTIYTIAKLWVDRFLRSI